MGAGFGVSTATAGRYVTETVDVLAERAPTLLEALRSHDPNEFLVLDGTLIRTDRVAADEPYYSMKHRHHGMNVQALTLPDGTPIWYSRALPGRTHDLTAARAHGVVQSCLSRQILVLADRAYRGAGATVRTPYYGRDLPEQYTQFNRDQRSVHWALPGGRVHHRPQAGCCSARVRRGGTSAAPRPPRRAEHNHGSEASTEVFSELSDIALP